MNNMNKIISSSLLIFLSAAFFFSCTKDISQIGVDIVGKNPLQVTYMDTITISLQSELVDSLRTDEISSHALGAYKDPIFGTVNGSVYSQFRITDNYSSSPFIGPNPALDSIILYIKYSDDKVYGDTNYIQNLTVYELGEDLHKDSTYYSFQNIRTKSEILGEVSFKPSFDSVYFYSKPDNPELIKPDTVRRIRPITIHLSEEFGNHLLNDTAIYETQESFLDAFKGLYITTLNSNLPTSGGSMVNASFDNPSETYIMLYYHHDTSSYMQGDTLLVNYNLEFKYSVDLSTANFSNYNHYDYLDADIDFYNQVINGDTALYKDKFYMQGLGGVRTTIKFPYAQKIPDYYNYSINEAKLIIHNIDTDQDPFFPLSPVTSFSLSQKVEMDSTFTDYFLIPDASGGEHYFGGTYNDIAEEYVFRITQYLQSLIEGNSYDNELRLEIIGSAVHPDRLVAGGFNPSEANEKKVVLEVIYTKIDNDK